MMVGAMISNAWEEDPKRLAFTFARYKFVARMMAGKRQVLEVGCNSGFASQVVSAHVGCLTAIDRDAEAIAETKNYKTDIRFIQHDIVAAPLHLLPWAYFGGYDGVFALDVLEHIWPEDEASFMENLCASLNPHGTAIIGMPSLESQKYASPNSAREHVNCKTEDELRSLLERYFHNVYLFGMNDETLHTGYGPMCHYRLALANSKKEIT